MTSEVEICNMALSNIRSTGINSLTEASLQAQQCKLKYPMARDMALSAAPWGFNRARAPLAELSASPVFNWLHVYQRPSDCLRINRLVLNIVNYPAGLSNPLDTLGVMNPDLKRGVAYEEFNVSGNRVIAANEPTLYIDYRSRITDPNQFDVPFVIALSWLLAAEIAVAIVGSESGRSLRGDALKMYSSYVAAAAAATMNQRYTAPIESEFITARN